MNELCYESINRSPFIADQIADLPAQIEAAADAGFSWMGIDRPSIDQHCERGGTLEELARGLDARGVKCFELQPLVVTDDERQTLADAERLGELVDALRPPWVQCGLSGEVSPAALANFRRAGEMLAGLGARLAVEFLPFVPLCSIAKTRALLDATEVPGAAIVVDTWHFFHGPDDWSDLDALTLDELAYPQFDDHPPLLGDDLMEETTERRVLPGDGVFDLSRFAKTLRDKGYSGPVSVEILSAELRRLPLPEFARRVYAAALPYWS